MVLSGQLKDYALPELLNTIEQGSKTGMLTIRAFNESARVFKNIHLYFKDGLLTTLSEDLMGKELVQIMNSKHFIDQSVIETIVKMEEKFQFRLPVGLYLQSKNILNEFQLQRIFNYQVIKRAIPLYEISDACFSFSSKVRPSMLELTGFKLQPKKLNLLGLRALQCWDHLLDKLPESNFTLYQRPQSKVEPFLSEDLYMFEDTSSFLNNLNALENKILRRADGKKSLISIADGLNLPLLEVQKIAFQLIHTGYIDELPMVAMSPVPEITVTPTINALPSISPEVKSAPVIAVNPNFLENLSNFLKNKVLSRV